MSDSNAVLQRDAENDSQAFILQAGFRALLDAMSRPGELVCLDHQGTVQDEACRAGLFPATMLLADVLLDAGTTLLEQDGREAGAERLIARRTHVALAPAERAAYVIVARDSSDEDARQLIASLCPGTLEDPHTGATVIVECSVLLGRASDGLLTGSASDVESCDRWLLTGPGIKDRAGIALDRSEVVRARNERGDEFPCGIDMVFVDDFGHMLAIPRTTVCKEVESWDM